MFERLKITKLDSETFKLNTRLHLLGAKVGGVREGGGSSLSLKMMILLEDFLRYSLLVAARRLKITAHISNFMSNL